MRIKCKRMTLAAYHKKHGMLDFSKMEMMEDGHLYFEHSPTTGVNYYPETRMVSVISVR